MSGRPQPQGQCITWVWVDGDWRHQRWAQAGDLGPVTWTLPGEGLCGRFPSPGLPAPSMAPGPPQASDSEPSPDKYFGDGDWV